MADPMEDNSPASEESIEGELADLLNEVSQLGEELNAVTQTAEAVATDVPPPQEGGESQAALEAEPPPAEPEASGGKASSEPAAEQPPDPPKSRRPSFLSRKKTDTPPEGKSATDQPNDQAGTATPSPEPASEPDIPELSTEPVMDPEIPDDQDSNLDEAPEDEGAEMPSDEIVVPGEEDLEVGPEDDLVAEEEISSALGRLDEVQSGVSASPPTTGAVTPAYRLPMPVRIAVGLVNLFDWPFYWVPRPVKNFLGYLAVSTFLLGIIVWILLLAR